MDKQKLISIVEDITAHKHEEEWFEFKKNWFEPHELGEYISSLSNAAALKGRDFGYFVWGIENDEHKIVGTDFDYHQDVKNEPLQHYLARQIQPDIGFEFDEINMQGERLVVLSVPAASKTPTAFDGVRYTRIGSSKEKLTKYPEQESQLFYILRHGFPTIANTESDYQDLSFSKLFVFFESRGVKLSKRTFKRNLGLLTESGKYNVLAQLLSDDCHITIRFALFNGENKASTMYSVKEFGYTCLLYSLQQILDYGSVLNIPQADEHNRRMIREEVLLFDQKAYEEAVINAFVHNSWIDGNAPMFTGFQDRIEILSRGNLPPRQTLEGFYAGESVPVNQALSDVFVKLHITEHTGRGVPKITEVYGKDAIRFNENSIVVTIPFERIGEGNDAPVNGKNAPVNGKNAPVNGKNAPVNGKNAPVDRKNAPVDAQVRLDKTENILEFCIDPKGISEIMELLKLKDKRSVRKLLNPLIDAGRIAMTVPDKPNSKNQKYITIR